MIRGKATQALMSGFAQGLFWGVGIALAATLLIPDVRKRFRPLLVRAAGGAMSLRDEIAAQAVKLREDVHDMVEEARHERDQVYGPPAMAEAVSDTEEG